MGKGKYFLLKGYRSFWTMFFKRHYYIRQLIFRRHSSDLDEDFEYQLVKKNAVRQNCSQSSLSLALGFTVLSNIVPMARRFLLAF